MTRRHIIFILAAATALSAAIVIISMAYSFRDQRAQAYKQSVEKAAVTETQTEIGYTLKEYSGELAVFRGSSSTPFKKLGIPVSVMTDQDRTLLETGIFVQTEKELKRLIEDYTP